MLGITDCTEIPYNRECTLHDQKDFTERQVRIIENAMIRDGVFQVVNKGMCLLLLNGIIRLEYISLEELIVLCLSKRDVGLKGNGLMSSSSGGN